MKEFLVKCLLFLLLLVVANGLADKWVGRSYFSPYREVDTTFGAYLLADSHGEMLLDYTEDYGIYNFSYPGDSYEDMHRKAAFLIENSQVDTIYISIDDHLLSPYREYKNNKSRSVIYSSALNYPNYYTYWKERYFRYNVVLLQPEVGSLIKNKLFAKLISKNPKRKEEVPWAMLPNDKKMKLCKNRAELQFSHDTNSVPLQGTLNQIIALCQTNDITLIGIKFPLAKDYLPFVHENPNSAASILQGSGCAVMDFTSIYLNEDQYFQNQDHLNEAGGKAFVEHVFQ